MWCATCKADVAAEVSPDTGSVRCATCGSEVGQAEAIRDRTKDAHAILERWSNKSMLDPQGPLPGTLRSTADAENLEPIPGTPAAVASEASSDRLRASGKTFRVDGPAAVAEVSRTGSARQRGQRKPVTRYADGPHGKQLAGPHFPLAPVKHSGWSVATGQWLAYIGVLGLTVGTAVVVYGHFGGQANYTPTGWLITTVGQMLLFLGVINLVSDGMEQSNEEVSQRIEILGEQLLRIEAAADEALQGPRIPAHRYAEGGASESASTRTRTAAE